MATEWWVWAAAAVALAIGEVLLPSYVLLGFAIGAGVVALGLLIGGSALAGVSLAVLLVAFAVASLIGWLALRRWLGVRKGQVRNIDHDINAN